MRGIGAGPHGCSAKKSCGLTPCVVRKGFTLIELLVVVLIIGFLAAVALPQYQKAVVKTRFATLKNLVKSIEVSQEAYFLANGEYTTNFDNLIVQLPAGGELSETKDKYTFVGWYCRLAAQVTACKVTNAGITYQQFYKHTTSPHAGKTKCLAWNDLAAQICLQETGDESPINYSGSSDGPYKAYTYQ